MKSDWPTAAVGESLGQCRLAGPVEARGEYFRYPECLSRDIPFGVILISLDVRGDA